MADERDFEEFRATLEEIKDSTDATQGMMDTVYSEVTRFGEPTVKGLLTEIEREGDQIENTLLPKVFDRLLQIERNILAAVVILAKPKDLQKTLEAAYKTVDEFLDKQSKGF